MKNIGEWFKEAGAYVLVDGQFGSTGKGLMAGFIAEALSERITHVTTNAGPNSGHTTYFGVNPDGSPRQIMTQQIPVASVVANLKGHTPITLLNAGAIIDPDILLNEWTAYEMDHRHIFIHPIATIIDKHHKEIDAGVTQKIAGTGKGIGPAIQEKVGRVSGREITADKLYMPMLPRGFPPHLSWDRFFDWNTDRVFVETAQGFSLGVNQARFYPHVTSRECTVMQAIADARIPARQVKKVIMTLRTYPIRVGNTQGSSGDCYDDQKEMAWGDIGVAPELTTVTKRVRRVFSWSRTQFREAVAANEPDILFLNFCNYMTSWALSELMDEILQDYEEVMGRAPDQILLGWGPHHSDISDAKEGF